MHRDLGTYLLRGMTPRRVFANLLGRATGVTGGPGCQPARRGRSDLSIIGFISHLPHSLPVALGVAMSFRYRERTARRPHLLR